MSWSDIERGMDCFWEIGYLAVCSMFFLFLVSSGYFMRGFE